MPDYTCAGQKRHYYVNTAPHTGSTYTWWIDGNTVPGNKTSDLIYNWNFPKIYLLEVQEFSTDGCPGPKISGQIFVNPPPEILVIASDTLVCDGESVTFKVENPSPLIWGKWIYDLIVVPDPGITGNTIDGRYAGPADLNEILSNHDREIHKVVYRFIPGIATDEGARLCDGKEVIITVWVRAGSGCREELLKIPDAFSPNSDGINDVWEIPGKDFYPDIEVTVLNRWGQTVWRSGRGYSVPWDGRSRGKLLPVDSYHYFLDRHDGTRPIVGTVTIVR